MIKQILPSVRATLILALYTGIIFPFIITAFAQVFFPFQANGSLVKAKDGKVVGSALIGQTFTSARYFHSRPSSAGSGYSGEASSASNLGPISDRLIKGVKDDPKTKDVDETFLGVKQLAEQYRKENDLPSDSAIPVDAVTRSGSGLDPHISEANAIMQSPRVARARHVPVETITNLVHKNIRERDLGVLGEPCVNTLALNMALDDLVPASENNIPDKNVSH